MAQAKRPSDCPFLATGVDVLLDDGPVFVVNKPGGLLTQAPPGIDSLEAQIKAHLGRRYLGVPHRLDRPASGAIVFAKHARAARRLAEQFEGRLVQKTYLAAVSGIVESNAETWTNHIRKIPDVARAEVVPEDHPDGREAVLHYEVIATEVAPAISILKIRLETGRMHQIRVQASWRGYPILGDEQYGATVPFGPQTEDRRQRWIALHASRLAFRHPMTREPVMVEAPLPEPWNGLPVS